MDKEAFVLHRFTVVLLSFPTAARNYRNTDRMHLSHVGPRPDDPSELLFVGFQGSGRSIARGP